LKIYLQENTFNSSFFSFNGVVHLDPLDIALRDAIKMLAVKNEDELPGLEDHKPGLASIVTEVLYVIQ
jgi:hypothetical protein